MQKSYEYHSVTLSVKMRHAGDQFAKKTWQFFRVWSWFWYKILPEIIWKKGWSIFFKLAFEYQELRTHTTTQTYFKKNLWHWAPHESWNPPGQLKKKSKTTNARPRRESARLRRKCLDSSATGCVYGAAPGLLKKIRPLFRVGPPGPCFFLIPKSLACLAFFLAAPKKEVF